MYSVNDFYNYTKQNNIKLLSEFNASWWNEYKANYNKFDRVFRRKYLTFVYMLQDRKKSISENVTDFIAEVEAHLLANSKRYEELYRIQVIDDTTYSLLDNYNMLETLAKTTGGTVNATSGVRTDSTSTTIGNTRTDYSNTIGSATERNISGSTPFDSPAIVDGFSQSGGGIVTDDIYLKGGDITTKDSHTDSGYQTSATQNNSESYSKGAQSDTEQSTGSENYTLTRKGNIGTQTADDIMFKHVDMWENKFNFYEFVFNEIANELLQVGD